MGAAEAPPLFLLCSGPRPWLFAEDELLLLLATTGAAAATTTPGKVLLWQFVALVGTGGAAADEP